MTINTDKACDILCEITPLIENLTTDKEVVALVKDIQNNGSNQEDKSKQLMFKLIPIVLKNNRETVYKVIATCFGKNAEDIKAQKVSETINQVKEILKDNELLSFFTLSKPTEATE